MHARAQTPRPNASPAKRWRLHTRAQRGKAITMNDPIPQPEAEPAPDAAPPKVSLVARMLAAGQAMHKRRAAKRAQLAGADVIDKQPWWKRRSAGSGKVLVPVDASSRTQRRVKAKRAAVPMVAKGAAKPLTKAQRKRRNREARERA